MWLVGFPDDALPAIEAGREKQGISTYRRYTQRQFKPKFSALLKPHVGKYTENSKNNFSNKHYCMIRATECNTSLYLSL